MLPGITRAVTTTRTFFPDLQPGNRVPNDILLVGCMKAIEETGNAGLLMLPCGTVREISEVKVNVSLPDAE